jgi:hypothetical protein
MRNSLRISELLWCRLRIANCKWGPSRPTARESGVCVAQCRTRTLSTSSSQKEPWETIRTIVSQLRSTVSSGIDIIAFGSLAILPLAFKGQRCSNHSWPNPYWHHRATTGGAGLPVNRIHRIIEKLSHLEGADLRRFLDSNTSPAVFGSINHVGVSPNGRTTVAISAGSRDWWHKNDRRGATR